jgi:hypothetical protein
MGQGTFPNFFCRITELGSDGPAQSRFLVDRTPLKVDNMNEHYII